MDNKGSYQKDIHDAGYEGEYLEKALTAETLINTAGREAESLNGKWNFGVDWYDTCRRAHWFRGMDVTPGNAPAPIDWDWEHWDYMNVPSCWNMEREELRYFEGNGLYTRVFTYIPQKKDERVFLRFEGAAYRASVFLNNEFIGMHDGASTPFSVEITRLLKKENRIVVSVDARLKHERIPMENTDWFSYGGLYRDIFFIRTPSVFIKDYFVRLVPKSAFSKIKACVIIDGADKNGAAFIEIPELQIKKEIAVSNGKGSIEIEAKPELWSPENPKLYDVVIKYGDDIIKEKIGFREISVAGTDVFLNGKKIFLNGVCVHEDHFQLGKTTNEKIIRETIRHLKELNGNFLRLAHYPHDGRFAKIADEEGILLWEEIPVYWACAFDNPATYKDGENQLAELILRDRNRASVALWSIGNENADTDDRLDFMSRLAKKARELDETRLVSAACLVDHEKLAINDRLAQHLDVIGINEYYGWYEPDFDKLPKILSNSKPDKPVIISEFGGDARKGQRGTKDDLFSEDKQTALYEKQVETLGKCPYIAGTTPWILYDFRCPRRLNRYQELFNRKGLIDAEREYKKGAFFVMRDFYAKRK